MSTDLKLQGWDLLGSSNFSDPEVAETAEQLIPLTAQQLQALLKIQPNALNYVLELVRRHVEEGISGDTYGRLFASLTSYLGEDPSLLLVWLAQRYSDQNEQKARLKAVSQYAPLEVSAFCGAIIARYGSDIETSIVRSNENPNNWSVISREVYEDKIYNTYLFRLTIEKFNGEKFAIECTPDSMLALATGIMYTTALINDRDAFSEDRITSFHEQADTLVELLRPKLEEEPKAPIANGVPEPA
ncbi:MAG: hypothetical protein R3C14_51415 [Caldilineaceae bacterium]